MPGPTHPLIGGLLMLALCGCASPTAGAGAGTASAGDITHITLERDCSGCPTGSVLVLGRDGEARRVLTGKARLGTDDRRYHAPLRREDFDALARLAASGGFFRLAARHEEAGLQDGPWSTLAIARQKPGEAAEQVHEVFRRGDAGPPELKALEAAIDALGQRLQFVPDASNPPP